jgi:hypothetical protein
VIPWRHPQVLDRGHRVHQVELAMYHRPKRSGDRSRSGCILPVKQVRCGYVREGLNHEAEYTWIPWLREDCCGCVSDHQLPPPHFVKLAVPIIGALTAEKGVLVKFLDGPRLLAAMTNHYRIRVIAEAVGDCASMK